MTETKTESDKIWNEVKTLPIDVFAIPGQKVKDNVKRYKVSPDALYVKLNSSAVLPALEQSLSRDGRGVLWEHPRYTMEQADGGFVVIRRAATPLVTKNLTPESE